MLGILIIDLLKTPVPAITFAWVLVGMVIGYPFGHLTKISWNSDKTQLALVGSQMVHICSFHYNQNYREHNHSHRIWLFILCIAIILLVSIGVTIGKTLGMMRQIRLALKSNGSSSSTTSSSS